MLSEDDAQSSIGGQNVRKEVKEYFGGGQLMFIGHSGGGVASYQGAKMPQALDRFDVKQVVQVGSPKVSISKSFRKKTSYLYDPLDPVPATVGSWAQGSLDDALHFRKAKPGKIKKIDITKVTPWIGNHSDYFNDTKESIDDSGKSNMARVLDAMWDWIKP